MVSIVAMVTVPPGLCIISHGVEVSNVMSFSLDQNCFSIFVVLYLLLGYFQCVLVSDRHTTSAACRKILSLISSRVKASLDNSSPSIFWYISRKYLVIFSVFHHRRLSSVLCMGCHFFLFGVGMQFVSALVFVDEDILV